MFDEPRLSTSRQGSVVLPKASLQLPYLSTITNGFLLHTELRVLGASIRSFKVWYEEGIIIIVIGIGSDVRTSCIFQPYFFTDTLMLFRRSLGSTFIVT